MNRKFSLLIAKIFIAIFSLVVCLGLLEIGLRVAGYLYSLDRPRASDSYGEFSKIRHDSEGQASILPAKIKREFIILCIGDSYTFGGGVGSGDTYPRQLQKTLTLNNPNRKFRVINAGVCEYNTRQVLIRLPELIMKYKPDAIILMAGSANRFNLCGYRLGRINFSDIINKLKIFKMAKILQLNIKRKILEWEVSRSIKPKNQQSTELAVNKKINFTKDGFPSKTQRSDFAEDYFDEMSTITTLPASGSLHERIWYYYNAGETEKALQLAETVSRIDRVSLETLSAVAYIYRQRDQLDKVVELCDEISRRYSEVEFALCQLSYFYNWAGEEYLERARYDMALEFLYKAVQLDCYDFCNYYLITKAYEFQSKYDAAYVIRILEKIIENNPGLRENELLINYIAFFKRKRALETKMAKWMRQDLDAIAKLCQRKRIKLIIQNYPCPFSEANRALKEVAERYSLPFVDNCAVFTDLTSREKREIYFLDDDHCTSEGHQLIVKNIYEISEKEGVFR